MLTVTSSYGQQDPQYTHYMYNMNVVNPAYAGSRETLSVGLLHRAQWVNVPGAPRTYTAVVHSPVGSNVGIGLSAIADEIGPVKEQNIFADVSYSIKTSENGKLAFGIKGGVALFNAKLTNLTRPAGSVYDELFANDGKGVFPNIGAGVYYNTNKFYAGLSIPNFMETVHFEDVDNNTTNTVASEKAHLFLTLGYVFELSKKFDLKPSLMTKGTVNSAISTEIAANFLYLKKFELGVGYRLGSSINGLVSFLVNDDLKLGYAYDHTISSFGDYTGATHEFFLQYDINMTPKKFKTPRFF